jgi:hypothetical protein
MSDLLHIELREVELIHLLCIFQAFSQWELHLNDCVQSINTIYFADVLLPPLSIHFRKRVPLNE